MAFLTLTDDKTKRTATITELAHLLVIDDDAVNRELMRRLFEQDCVLTCVSSGQAGLEIIRQTPVDVVLLDIMMPGMNGFEMLERLRANPDTVDLPVILISGLTDNENIVKGLQLGANDYLTKPVNIHVARARLRTQVKLKRLLDAHKRAIAQLEELHHLRDHFFRMASHDLKNPLTNLRLASYEMRYYLPDNPDVIVCHSAIETTVTDMQALIEDFLDVAALQGGKLEVESDYVELADCLAKVVRDYNAVAAAKDIAIRVENSGGTVIGDRKRLIQVISNLVSNAIKFSPPETTVYLRTQRCGDLTRVYVCDEGPGIAPEDQGKLFREFGKGKARPTGGEASHGLGLWIVQQIVQLMGGQAGVESQIGQGARFWIEIPTAERVTA
jgi:two-component system, sensor histidine kinase and response regulator